MSDVMHLNKLTFKAVVEDGVEYEFEGDDVVFLNTPIGDCHWLSLGFEAAFPSLQAIHDEWEQYFERLSR